MSESDPHPEPHPLPPIPVDPHPPRESAPVHSADPTPAAPSRPFGTEDPIPVQPSPRFGAEDPIPLGRSALFGPEDPTPLAGSRVFGVFRVQFRTFVTTHRSQNLQTHFWHPTRPILGAIILLAIWAALFPLCYGEDLPQKRTVASPHRAFEIVQEYAGSWQQKVHFATGRDETIEDDLLWPAEFAISPDERWILRIQKTGSGDNVGLLYRVGPHERLQRTGKSIDELAFAFLASRPQGLPPYLYHQGIEFVAWDMKASRLRFTVHASGEGGKGVDRALIYHLREGNITAY